MLNNDLELQELKSFFNSLDMDELTLNTRLGIESNLRLAGTKKENAIYLNHLTRWKHELETNKQIYTI